MSTETAESKCILRFVKLTNNASTPSKGSKMAAGYDLSSAYDYIIPSHGKNIVFTDIQVEIPDGCYARIAPRSSLAANSFIDIGAGVIDADYRGNIKIVMFNHSNVDFVVSKGDRIAQLICERIFYPQLVEVKSLNKTERESSGFGSTGM